MKGYTCPDGDIADASKNKIYIVPVWWSVQAVALVKASSEEEAADLVTGMGLDRFKNVDYIPDSFEVDWDNIKETRFSFE